MEAIRDIEFTQIAGDWDSTTLGREHEPPLLLVRNGLTTDQSKESGEFRITRIETISDGIIDEQKIRWVSGLKPDQVEKYRIQRGDILFSHINSDPHLGKSAIAGRDYPDLLHGMNLLLLRANPRVLEPEFLHFLFCYYRTKGVFIKICSRSVNQSSINQAKLKALEIPVPPLAEQRKIATVLGLVQRAIEQQERLIALTTELKKALFHQLFTQGLRGEPKKQTEIGLVPESWDLVIFENFATLQRGFDLPRSTFKLGDIPVVGATTIIGYHNTWNVQGPGVTVVRSGSSAGKPLFVPTNFWAHNVVLFVKDFHGNNPKFVYYKIQSLDLTKYREGVAVPTLNRNSFRKIPVAIPEREEQDEFVRTLDAIEDRERVLAQKRELLVDLFRTLLYQLMSAQIRVSDLDLPELEQEGKCRVILT